MRPNKATPFCRAVWYGINYNIQLFQRGGSPLSSDCDHKQKALTRFCTKIRTFPSVSQKNHGESPNHSFPHLHAQDVTFGAGGALDSSTLWRRPRSRICIMFSAVRQNTTTSSLLRMQFPFQSCIAISLAVITGQFNFGGRKNYCPIFRRSQSILLDWWSQHRYSNYYLSPFLILLIKIEKKIHQS